jgi:glycosyltransferase involved in cell wall biosynthesis
VRLLGRVAPGELPALYSAADLFVLGSHHEGSGYALLEACACGAVPIVTDIPAFRMITGGGSIGAMWRVADPDDLARALVATARRDRAALRAAVMQHFAGALSWGIVGQRALHGYRDIAARRTALSGVLN